MERRLAATLAADVVGYSRLMGQSVFGPFGGYDDVNDADRLRVMRWVGGGKAIKRQAASSSQMGRFDINVNHRGKPQMSLFGILALGAIALLTNFWSVPALAQEAKQCLVLEEAPHPYKKNETAMSLLNTCKSAIHAFWCYQMEGDAQCAGVMQYRMQANLKPGKRKFNRYTLLKGARYTFGACGGRLKNVKQLKDGKGGYGCRAQIDCGGGKKVNFTQFSIGNKGQVFRFELDDQTSFTTPATIAVTSPPETQELGRDEFKPGRRDKSPEELAAQLSEFACGPGPVSPRFLEKVKSLFFDAVRQEGQPSRKICSSNNSTIDCARSTKKVTSQGLRD